MPDSVIQAILFDFGGTLDADGGQWLARFNAIYDHLGFTEIPKSHIKEAFHHADAKADAEPALRSYGYRAMITAHVHWQFEHLGLLDPAREKQVAEDFYRPAERLLHRNVHVLEKLRHAGFRLGVLSNFYGNVEVLCQEAQLSPHLELILDSMHVGIRKPDPALYRLAAERLQLPPEQVLMVGDSFERDMTPARSIGMRTAWLLGDRAVLPPEAQSVDFVLHSLEDLPRRLPPVLQGESA